MASESEGNPAADDDTVVVGPEEPQAADEPTRAGGEDWPVTDLYYVEPDKDVSPAKAEPAERDVITVASTGAREGPVMRRFPPDVSPGILLVILGVVAALILGGVLLALDDEDPTASQTPTGAQTTPPPAETTTPTAPNDDVAVRNVEGMSLEKARTALEEQGLRVRVTRSPSERPQGEVVGQSPAAGAEVAERTVVALVVSSGPETTPPQSQAQVEVPDVIGQSASSAVSAVRDAGLEARVREVSSSERSGTVVDQTPAAGTEVDEGTTVTLEVAKARPEVQRIAVPDVVGSTAASARGELRSAGLSVSTVTVVSQEPAGTVIEQSPRAGAEVRKGTRVRLTVSAGPATVEVPDVSGLDEAAARSELERAGFRVQVMDEPTTDPAQDGTVLRQTPEAGSSAREGAVVTITVARLE